jgi:hypothetical protein
MVDGVEREPIALERIGADVGEKHPVDADDRPVALEPDLDVVDLLAVLAQGHQILAARLHPLHRPPESE